MYQILTASKIVFFKFNLKKMQIKEIKQSINWCSTKWKKWKVIISFINWNLKEINLPLISSMAAFSLNDPLNTNKQKITKMYQN